MTLTQESLTNAGFAGFVPVADLATATVPAEPGVYVVLREDGNQPAFRAESVGGWFKGHDPSVPVASLDDAWVPDAQLLYVGGTGNGESEATLRSRLEQLRRFAAGEPVGHWGGRYLWQLWDRHRLLVAWMPVPAAEVRDVQRELLAEFWDEHEALPFANLRWP
ncbi:hypothetical protein [Naasia sp. SYSU D00948]|uniref:hypothetical protein n=1 Tax=Naasia sp. SYSU D00948 TaxID=2817379 RepID=UPI001B3159B4|nr:hypothetical protein [Naasia sp. SYSU D00948]